MDTSKIQLVFKENSKIEKIIEQNSFPSSYTLNDKIKAYLNSKAQQIIKYHNPYLEFNINNINVNSTKNVFMLDYLPRYVFMVAYTLSHTNHPYLIYFNLDDKFINVLLPFGREYQQANTEDYINVINSIVKNTKNSQIKKKSKTKTKSNLKSKIGMNESNASLLTAIYVLLDNTIKTRKYGIIYSKFSILTCENMTLCIHKITEISKMNIQEIEKQNLYIKVQDYYRIIGIEVLQHYFNLLEKKEYGKANDFLKGGHNRFSEYYGKTRLNTFFKNNRSILGHLEVFISLYELLSICMLKLNLFI